jgi:DNA-binding XRE family transcriptional regulator
LLSIGLTFPVSFDSPWPGLFFVKTTGIGGRLSFSDASMIMFIGCLKYCQHLFLMDQSKMSPGKPKTPESRKPYSNKEISDFAFNLQRLRLERKQTQTQLGETVGVSLSQISQYEAGVFPSTAQRIIALADALGVTCDELLRPRKE